VPRSTAKALICFSPSDPVPVTAVMVTPALISVPALVMNTLRPSMTHSSPCRRARVRVPPASEPASGSVSPKAQRRSPLSRQGRYFCFCSAVPK
jgi:hypothetical protein